MITFIFRLWWKVQRILNASKDEYVQVKPEWIIHEDRH